MEPKVSHPQGTHELGFHSSFIRNSLASSFLSATGALPPAEAGQQKWRCQGPASFPFIGGSVVHEPSSLCLTNYDTFLCPPSHEGMWPQH